MHIQKEVRGINYELRISCSSKPCICTNMHYLSMERELAPIQEAYLMLDNKKLTRQWESICHAYIS